MWLVTVCISLLLMEGGAILMEKIVQSYFADKAYASGQTPYVDYENNLPLFDMQSLNEGPTYVRTIYHPFVSSQLQFPYNKSDSTIRIFCLGGSAAMGWPHDLSLSYPAFLQHKLEKVYPNRKIEVINAGASTYASYRIKTLFDEIVNYQPNLILLYTGNNEFLERILYEKDGILLNPWRSIATIRILHRAKERLFKRKHVIDIASYQPTFMIDIALGNSSQLKTSSEQLLQVKAHYRHNISQMVQQAKDLNIPIALLNVPVNQKDWIPHASIHEEGIDIHAWRRHYRKAIEAYEQNNFVAAIQAFRNSINLDSSYAKSYYYLGKSYLSMEMKKRAKDAFLKGLEEDGYPFRALHDFNQILEDISLSKAVPLVDLVECLESIAQNAIIGEDVLVDHVHPTVASNERIAQTVLATLHEADILPKLQATDVYSVQMTIPKEDVKPLSLIRHLFLIYQVLLQFDKLGELDSQLQKQPDSIRRSTNYLLLKDQLSRYIKVVNPYRKLISTKELGLTDSLYTPKEIQIILEDYYQSCRNNLTHNMSNEVFQQFIPN